MSEKPITGTWVLIAPGGREYKAASPLKCCRKEQLERIPVKKQLENLHHALFEVCELCGDDIHGEKYSIGDKECPAYLYPLCGACYGTINKKPTLLAAKHTGMRVDYSGLLDRIANGCKVRPDQRFMLGELSKHLLEMSERFYSGDIPAVDEFLQLYCLDDGRQ